MSDFTLQISASSPCKMLQKYYKIQQNYFTKGAQYAKFNKCNRNVTNIKE